MMKSDLEIVVKERELLQKLPLLVTERDGGETVVVSPLSGHLHVCDDIQCDGRVVPGGGR